LLLFGRGLIVSGDIAASFGGRCVLQAISPEIFGRDDELAALQRFFSNADSRALVLEGEPGIGKTTLWREALEMAKGLGQRVLATRPAGAEAQLSLSGLGDLLEAAPRETIAALPEIQRRALAIVLAEEASAAKQFGGRVLGAAFLNLLRALAKEKPLVVAVDDLQWLDPSSARVLLFACRRLRDSRAKLLASCRGEPGGPLPFDCELALAEEMVRLPVGPLSEGALHRLLQKRLGVNLTRAQLAAVHETSGGNPFYALELARAGENGHADGLLRLPRSLELLVSERLRRLPVATREALAYASALSDPTIGVLERAGVSAALEPAIESGIVELDRGLLLFDHPLLAAAAWNAVGAKEKQTIHRALSEAVEDEEQRARHLALATPGPDRQVALALERAAASAHRRTAPTAAAELYELARQMVPPGDDALWARLTERTSAMHYEAGEWERPLQLADEALGRLPPGPERAAILLVACEMRPGHLDLARQIVEESGEEALRIWALTALSQQLCLLGRIPEALEAASRACDLAVQLERPDLLGVCLVYRAAMELHLELPAAHDDLAAARDIEREIGHDLPTSIHNSWQTWTAFALLQEDDLEAARQLIESRMAVAEERGDERNYCMIAFDLIQLEIEAGNWERAETLAEKCRELSGVSGYTEGNGDLTRMLGMVSALRGECEAARELIEESFAFFARTSDRAYETLAYAARLFLRLCEGKSAAIGAAVDEFEQIVSTGRAGGIDPPWMNSTQGDEIEALVLSGRAERARQRIDDIRRTGKKRRWDRFLAWADRGDGMLLAQAGDLDGARAALESALRHHDRPPSLPFERARTLLLYGQVLRRSKRRREARQALNEALAELERLGARLYAERARDELKRVGGRAAATEGELTATEERIARLVASGLSNKEVAAQSFVTVRTVEATLTRIYAKLRVSSRLQLSRALESARSVRS
jgi:DNA-binding CsgD family transcriptional regulator